MNPMSITARTDSQAELFQDRDLAWLEFNRRVLHEAEDDRTPLLERVKFLAIFSSNLDEFFMKRVGLSKRHGMLMDAAASNGSAPHQHLLQLRQAILPLLAKQADVYARMIVPQLAGNGIHLLGWDELTDHQAEVARHYFQQKVFPILTTLAGGASPTTMEHSSTGDYGSTPGVGYAARRKLRSANSFARREFDRGGGHATGPNGMGPPAGQNQGRCGVLTLRSHRFADGPQRTGCKTACHVSAPSIAQRGRPQINDRELTAKT
jgi:hypothetical protein